MSTVKLEYSVEYLAYKVIRINYQKDKTSYFTSTGWKDKKAGEPVTFDETMLWQPDELRQLVNQLLVIEGENYGTKD